MKKVVLLCSVLGMLTLTSCNSKKKIAELENKNTEIQDVFNSATVKLTTCLAEKDGLTSQISLLREANADLKRDKDNITVLTAKGAENLEKTLESMREKDIKISRLQDALTK